MHSAYLQNDFAEGSKILLDTNKKIISLDQHNFIEILKIISNATKNFDILATDLSYIIILIVQQNYFSDLYSAKILNLSAKPFFPCTYTYVYDTNTYISIQLTRAVNHERWCQVCVCRAVPQNRRAMQEIFGEEYY